MEWSKDCSVAWLTYLHEIVILTALQKMQERWNREAEETDRLASLKTLNLKTSEIS